jgi:hypothetical protein
VKDRRQQQADQGRRKRAAENDDDGVIAHEHAKAAANEHESRDDRRRGKEPEPRRNIRKPHPTRDGEPYTMALFLRSWRLWTGYWLGLRRYAEGMRHRGDDRRGEKQQDGRR